MSEILTTVFSQCKNLTQRVIHASPSCTFGIDALETYELIEIKDGLLATPKRELMKARSLELFPETIQEYIRDAEKVEPTDIDICLDNVKLRTEGKTATFKKEFFEYLQGIGVKEYYLSNIPLPGENSELYPLIARYKYGLCVVAPVEV
jgi:hypothetical protein